MFDKARVEFQYGSHQVVMETGEIARQATGSVLLSCGDTVVLATVVAARDFDAKKDFFPLTVDYVEKTYAAGRIPGGFFKREGKPSEKEVLTSRLIDRPIRPLFPEGFKNEVQVVIHVLSVDPEIDPDVPALIASSAALSVSGVPFLGPLGASRVGYVDGQYVLNPTATELKKSRMDLVVAGTDEAVLMVESEANQLSEEIMLGGIVFGHDQMQIAIKAIDELVEKAGKPDWDWQAPPVNQSLIDMLNSEALEKVRAAYQIRNKQERTVQIDDIRASVYQFLLQSMPDLSEVEFGRYFFDLEASIVRGAILNGESRIDGRDTRTVRPIEIRTGLLPRTHGSALFTRGETQSLSVTTLGTRQDEQIIDGLQGEFRERFMLHYNMPPFATGEVGRVGSPKRREVGHGRLAKRALFYALPHAEDFPYSIRVVSEITESNGSSSMASVCAGCLAMMDAGVPLRAHVAGVAMGLIKDGNKFAVLTDILGDEDHLGDMDFKVAGTEIGVTALQMDIKIQGITREIMQVALAQAKDARMHILGKMRTAVSGAKTEVSLFAPRLTTFKINPDRIRDVIGKGGATIRAITEETGTTIDIQDDGTVTIASVDAEKALQAQRRIVALSADVELGDVYEGKVLKLLEFGAVVEILPGRDGLLHISQVSNQRIAAIGDVLSVGQSVKVKVVEKDEKGRVRLSMRALLSENSDIA